MKTGGGASNWIPAFAGMTRIFLGISLAILFNSFAFAGEADAVADSTEIDNTITFANNVEQDGGSNQFSELAQGRILMPHLEAELILESSGWLRKNGITGDNPKISVVIENMPKNGRIEYIESGEFSGLFRYTPDSGFLGRDFVSFIVSIENKRIRVNLILGVLNERDDDSSDDPDITPEDAEFRCGLWFTAQIALTTANPLIVGNS